MEAGLNIKAILPKIGSGRNSAVSVKKDVTELNEVTEDNVQLNANPEEVLEYQKIEEITSQNTNPVNQVAVDDVSQSRFKEAVIISEGENPDEAALNYLSEENIKLNENIQLQMQITDLKNTDRQVKSHEQAHKNVGGIYASTPVYEYTVGPDGKQYAVNGSVSIDTSIVANNPEATIDKMEVVKRAALAPVDPSAQDHSVAAKATMIQIEARNEIAQEKRSDNTNNEPKSEIEKIIASYTQPLESIEPAEEYFYFA